MEFIDNLNYLFRIYIKRPISKIIKIFNYIPILWKDEDWDYSYLLDLVDYKLKRMCYCLANNDIVENNELAKMLLTIKETRTFIYNHLNADDVYEKYVERPPYNAKYSTKELDNGHFTIIILNGDTNQELTEEEEKNYNQWLNRKYNFENEQWEMIWKNISKHGRSWWD